MQSAYECKMRKCCRTLHPRAIANQVLHGRTKERGNIRDGMKNSDFHFQNVRPAEETFSNCASKSSTFFGLKEKKTMQTIESRPCSNSARNSNNFTTIPYVGTELSGRKFLILNSLHCSPQQGKPKTPEEGRVKGFRGQAGHGGDHPAGKGELPKVEVPWEMNLNFIFQKLDSMCTLPCKRKLSLAWQLDLILAQGIFFAM